MVAAAAALEENTVGGDEVFFCENGWAMRAGRVLRDHKPFAYLTLTGAMENSSNICMAKINERIPSGQFYDYIRRFGFGERSRIDLPGEHPGGIRHPRDWSPLSHDSLSIGQEISVTPVQMVAAFSRHRQRRLAAAAAPRRPAWSRANVEHAFKAERRRRVFSQQNSEPAHRDPGSASSSAARAPRPPWTATWWPASPVPRRRPKRAATAAARSWCPSSATRRPRRRAS